KLLARDVARDGLAAGSLTTVRMSRQIRRDAFPRHSFVARAMHVLRTVVEHVRIVGRRGHRRNSLHAIDQIFRGIAIKRLRANPVVLLLTGLEIHHAELSLARAVDDVGIRWIRHDWTSFTTRTSAPVGS